MKITIIGFGYIGAVISAVLSNAGNKIVAIDNNSKSIEELNLGCCQVPEPSLKALVKRGVETGNLSGSLEFDSVINSDVILVTVGTPLSDKFNADLSAIRNVFYELAKFVQPGQIIMIKSTVPPGITRQMANEYFGGREDIFIGFSPERLAEGNAIEEFTTLPIIVGGINDESTNKCAIFWEKVLDVRVIRVSSSEAAEIVKLADNQWIDLNIALANELAVLCDSLPYDVDILEVIEGANTLKKGDHFVNILTPSIGVGGYCLTKDPWFLSSLAKKNKVEINLPKYGRMANEKMPIYAAKTINKFLSENVISHYDAKISILGYSFKTNSGDVRFTPMEYFIEELFRLGYKNIHVYDPTINSGSIKNNKVVQHLNWKNCIGNSSCIVYGAAHNSIKEISTNQLLTGINTGALIYDGRRFFSKDEIKYLIKNGANYVGVGRSFNNF
jgi:UDP-N-acetyl-D-mannosaminuronic acid dehydrogenase